MFAQVLCWVGSHVAVLEDSIFLCKNILESLLGTFSGGSKGEVLPPHPSPAWCIVGRETFYAYASRSSTGRDPAEHKKEKEKLGRGLPCVQRCVEEHESICNTWKGRQFSWICKRATRCPQSRKWGMSPSHKTENFLLPAFCQRESGSASRFRADKHKFNSLHVNICVHEESLTRSLTPFSVVSFSIIHTAAPNYGVLPLGCLPLPFCGGGEKILLFVVVVVVVKHTHTHTPKLKPYPSLPASLK